MVLTVNGRRRAPRLRVKILCVSASPRLRVPVSKRSGRRKRVHSREQEKRSPKSHATWRGDVDQTRWARPALGVGPEQQWRRVIPSDPLRLRFSASPREPVSSVTSVLF